MRWPVGALAAGGLAVGLLIVAPGAAQADERIRSYSVRLRIEPSGDLLVSERISYDFGPEPRHGILRDCRYGAASTTGATASTRSRSWGLARRTLPTSTGWRMPRARRDRCCASGSAIQTRR